MSSSVITANKFKRVSAGNRTLIDGHTLNYRKGSDWYVDASRSGTGSGKSFDDAFLTMAEAFAAIGSGDSIYVVGDVREQLVTPVQVFDVRVIGMGNRPRNADSTPAGGNTHGVTWRAPASGGVAAKATVQVLQQGWVFENILFNMLDTNAAGIELSRNAAAGNSERDASHATIVGCRFAGAGIGIRSGSASFSENVYNVEVAYCKFNDCTFGIKSSNSQPNSWSIHHNEFQTCTNVITAALQHSKIYENILSEFTAAGSSGGIDLNGGVGTNIVTKNYLSGTYSIAGGYRVGGAGDEWAGNFNTLSGGITVSDPA